MLIAIRSSILSTEVAVTGHESAYLAYSEVPMVVVFGEKRADLSFVLHASP